MEEHSERLGPQSGQEPQIQAPSDVGDAGEAETWDVEEDTGVVASEAGKDAVAEAWQDDAVEAWQDDAVEAWDAEEDAHAVVSDAGENVDGEAWEEHGAGVTAWDVVQEPDAVTREAGESAGDAFAVPDAPEPRPATGEPRVDAALARLDELGRRPVTEHRAIFEDVHRRLRDVLGELDSREPDQPSAAGAGAERRAGR
jgi:hypothetical protein